MVKIKLTKRTHKKGLCTAATSSRARFNKQNSGFELTKRSKLITRRCSGGETMKPMMSIKRFK